MPATGKRTLVFAILAAISTLHVLPPETYSQSGVIGFVLMPEADFTKLETPKVTVKDLPAIKRTFTRITKFQLPMQMDEQTRQTFREVQLHVKADGGDWQRMQTITPNMRHFNYDVPKDGEYCFSIVTVDQNGRTSPNDLASMPSLLRVVVDTIPPKIESKMITDEKGMILRIGIDDANPDIDSVWAIVTIEGIEKELQRLTGQTAFVVPAKKFDSPIKVTAADRAGNTTMIQFDATSGTPESDTAVGSVNRACMPLPTQVTPRRNFTNSIFRRGRRG